MKRKLRVTFVLLDSLFPPAHGGAHMIRSLADGLSAQGYETSVLVLFAEAGDEAATAQTVAKLRSCGLACDISDRGTVRFRSGALTCAGVGDAEGRFLPFVLSELTRLGTEAVILSDIGGTPAHTLLATIQSHFGGLLVYAPQTVHMLPGGPFAVMPHAAGARALKKCRIVAPSHFSASYISEHFNVVARNNIPPMFGAAEDWPEPAFDRFGLPFGVFNPNLWKGLPLLLELADKRPGTCFVVRCGWRATPGDLVELQRRHNISLQHAQDGSTIYDLTSTILVPSLCYESLGLVSIEAMLRGLPAVTAHHGGLEEAGLGAAILCRVAPIEFGRDPNNPDGRALEHVPRQPLGDWLAAIDRLQTDQRWYAEQARNAHEHALAFVRGLSWEATEAAFFG